ncbi:MAG: T9SS type A sorting domain-containing protein [Patescibacteria group bacterium]
MVAQLSVTAENTYPDTVQAYYPNQFGSFLHNNIGTYDIGINQLSFVAEYPSPNNNDSLFAFNQFYLKWGVSSVIAGPIYSVSDTITFTLSPPLIVRVNSVAGLQVNANLKDPVSGTARLIAKNVTWTNLNTGETFDNTNNLPAYGNWITVVSTAGKLLAQKSPLDIDQTVNDGVNGVELSVNNIINNKNNGIALYNFAYQVLAPHLGSVTNYRLFANNVQIGSTITNNYNDDNISFNLNLPLYLQAYGTTEVTLKADLAIGVTNQIQVVTKEIYGQGINDGYQYYASGVPVLSGITNIIVSTPPTNTSFATNRDWYNTLNNLFHWEQMFLPERDVPDNITDQSFRRALALGLSSASNYEHLDEPLYFWIVLYDLDNLFGDDIFCGIEDREEYMKSVLRDKYHINLDSIESDSRQINFQWFGDWDTVNAKTLKAFAKLANQIPVLTLSSFESTTGDSVSVGLTVDNNYMSIGGFQTRILGYSYTKLLSWQGNSGFNVTTVDVGSSCTEYYQGNMVLGFGSTTNLTRTPLAKLRYKPNVSGVVRIRQDKATLSDETGSTDFPVWAHRAIWYMYLRSDVNMNKRTTIADAVRARYLLLHNLNPDLPNLGDENYNGVFDFDDPYEIRLRAAWGYAKTMPNNILSLSDPVRGTILLLNNIANEKLIVNMSFDGNELNGAKRFAGKLVYNPQIVTIEKIEYPGNYLTDISGSYDDSLGNLTFARYDSNMSTGTNLVIVYMKKINEGNPGIELQIAKHNFFTFGEDVRVEYGVTGVGDEVNSTPKQFALAQNFPNPFNPTTTIRYSLPTAVNVTLKVYNMLGQELTTLLNGIEQEAGERSVDFNAAELPSGVYIYKIQAGTFVDVKKLILQK